MKLWKGFCWKTVKLLFLVNLMYMYIKVLTLTHSSVIPVCCFSAFFFFCLWLFFFLPLLMDVTFLNLVISFIFLLRENTHKKSVFLVVGPLRSGPPPLELCFSWGFFITYRKRFFLCASFLSPLFFFFRLGGCLFRPVLLDADLTFRTMFSVIAEIFKSNKIITLDKCFAFLMYVSCTSVAVLS